MPARYRATDIAIALLLFYLPWAHFPQPRFLRTVLLQVPTWGSGNESTWSITSFLVPETVLVFILVLGVLNSRSVPSRLPLGVGPLVWASSLMLAGGVVSLAASQYAGISIAGFAARCTVFALAGVMAFSAPSAHAIRLWTYAAIAGTSVMCAAGLYYFFQDFGVPSSLASLPIIRVSPGIVDYQKATYGFASNTVDLLVLTTPTAVALLMAKSASTVARAFLAAAVLLMCANLLVSFERWGWVCIGLALILTVLYYRRQRRGLLLLAVLVLAAAVLGASAVSQLGDYFQQALDPTSGSNTLGRVHAWGEGLAVLIANPAGVGLGTVGTILAISDTSSHNLFIDIGVEGGILALAGSLVWAGYHLSFAVRVIARGDSGDEWAFALLLGTLTFVMFGVFFNSLLYLSGLMVWLAFWWCFPVMAVAVARFPELEGVTDAVPQIAHKSLTPE